MDRFSNFFDDLCELLDVDCDCHIKWEQGYFDVDGFPCPEFKLLDTTGATSTEHTIYIDMTKYEFAYQGFFVIAHEMRHMYQRKYIKTHKNKQAKEWKKEFENYQGSGVSGYENQSIEIDANAFACFVFDFLFDSMPEIKCDQDKLNDRIRYIRRMYKSKLK